MKTAKKFTGLALAVTAAAVFSAAPLAVSADSHTNVGKCMGVNACKGKSSCKTADNACKGQNACKGKGFVYVNPRTCEQLGGEMQTS